tara:strand:+ start:5980 stop:6759 length:780 start_codon:yes stop_codon:yes gene_type:complete
MKHFIYLFLFFSSSIFSQEIIGISPIKNIDLQTERLVSIDNFGTTYFIDKNVFHKQNTTKTITYNNLQLGDITTAGVFNPLKINLFYKDFNTVVILDNRLAEIFKIDFNTKQPYRNISFISTGHDNTLWLFNQDTQELELYDYKSNTTRVVTLPIQDRILDMTSNYNYCYLLTENQLLTYNYFGSLIAKTKNEGYTAISESNENLFLKKENSLFYLKKNTKNALPIELPNLLIQRFFVTNETLYIYDSEILHQYQLKIN